MTRRVTGTCVLVVVVALLLGAAIMAAIDRHVGTGESPAPIHRVSAAAGSLTLDDEPWWPTGFNAYQIATDWSLNAGCGAEVDVDAYFRALPPKSLTRFSLFAPFTQRKDDGTVDFSAVDRIFTAAARHHQLVLPVLAGGDGACDGEQVRDLRWYRDGWRTERSTAHGTYADWVTVAVTRWRNEPALAGWTAVGEPEPATCTGSRATAACGKPANRTCAPDATAVLRKFFDDVGGLIRSLDRGHLQFAGLLGGDQCGTDSGGYATVGASPGIDVLEYHDYSVDSLSTPSAADSLIARIATARTLNKPLLLAEIGVKAGSCRSAQARASLVRDAIATARADGVAGALAWAYVPDPRPHECTYDIGPGDPLWPSIS